MKNEQTLLLLKEKLKTKDREISKLQNFKQEWEDQVKNKFKEMEGVIAEQKRVIEKTTKNFHKEKETPKEKEIPEKDNEEPSSKLKIKFEAEKSKNKSLENKNDELSEGLKTSDKNLKKVNKQLSILVKEYKRLKDSQKDKSIELEDRLKKGKDSYENIRKALDLANTEKDKLEKELKAKKNTESKPPRPEDPARMEAMVNSKEKLETQLNDLSKSLEESKSKSESLLKERESLQKLLDGIENPDDSDSNKNIAKALQEQIEKLKSEGESYKQKAEGLLKEVSNLKGGSKKPQSEKTKEPEEEGGGEEGGAPAWMCTFADMVTLLMVFFVIFYSVNADNTAKMLSVIEGTENKSLAIGVLEALDEIKIKDNLQNMVGLGPGKGQFEFQVEAEIKKDLEKAKIDGADVGRNGKKIFVTVPANNLFEPGSAGLTKQAIPVLNKLSQAFLKFTDYQINIAGHTDDMPISTVRFPSNWELSSSRATAVLRFFADKGIDPLKMTATGRSDLFPLFSNSTEIGRSKNRRVEFVLEKDKKD